MLSFFNFKTFGGTATGNMHDIAKWSDMLSPSLCISTWSLLVIRSSEQIKWQLLRGNTTRTFFKKFSTKYLHYIYMCRGRSVKGLHVQVINHHSLRAHKCAGCTHITGAWIAAPIYRTFFLCSQVFLLHMTIGLNNPLGPSGLFRPMVMWSRKESKANSTSLRRDNITIIISVLKRA